MPRSFTAMGALLLLAALAGTVQRAAAVPFAELSPPPALRLVQTSDGTRFCALSASGRDISSVATVDLLTYRDGVCSGGTTFNAIDLSNNSLTALPDNFLSALPAKSIKLLDLSRNKFTAAGVANLHLALAELTPLPFLDLSFNNIGPSVPPSLRQWPSLIGFLLLMGCGITDVQPNAFAGNSWQSIDLSLNDLRSGLHSQSFRGANYLYQIGLSNCNLRSSSIMPGTFNVAPVGDVSVHLFMDNMVADLTGMDSTTLSQRFPRRGLLPKLPLDPRLLSAAEINPPGQPHTNKITLARYLDSWANFFDPFPSGLFYTAAPGAVKQGKWATLTFGDVTRMDPSWFGNATFDFTGTLAFSLAPQSVVAAMGGDVATYCPLQSVMQALTVAPVKTVPTMPSLRITGHDQPLPADPLPLGCAVPDCAAMGGCRQLPVRSVTLSTEPAMLQRNVMRWLRDVGLGGSGRALSFIPPPLNLWNPALNHSDWAPTDLLCDLDISTFTLPALPYSDDATGISMPFPQPSDMLQCLSSSTQLTTVDWRAVHHFSAGMLASVPSTRAITLQLNIESLYGGVRPVPVGFFDPLSSLITVSGDCGSSCARLASKCPYLVDGACQVCPLGSSKRSFQSQYAYCSSCPTGFYCDAALSISPIPCPLGSFQPLSGQNAKSSCQACPTGMTTVAVGQNSTAACVSCPAGWFCDPNPLAVAHSPCPAGSEQPLLGQTSAASCTLCVAGKFASSNGTVSCGECSPGRFAGSAGSSSCQQCAAGRYQELTEQSACQLCSAGSFNSAFGSVSAAACVPCSTGAYCASPGAAAPTPCPAGSEQPLLGQTSVVSCTLCPAGKFATASGTASCAECAMGMFAAAAGAISCSACAAGQFQGAVGQSACSTCSAGRFAASGSSACTSCSTGRFAASDGAGSCQQCAAGQYQDGMGQTACRQCNAGSANPNVGSVSSTTCQLCTPGLFAALLGSAFCSECTAGKFSTTAGQSSCALCPVGTYSALTGRSDPVSCGNCPPGRFNPTEGGSSLSSCQLCPPGRASNVPGVAVCSVCGAGYFNAKNASAECDPCPANTYQPQTAATDAGFCTACPPDAPLSPPASASQLQCTTGVVCAAGFYTTAGDAPCTSPCPKGSACQGGTVTSCAAGSYADREGMGSCTPCGVGSVGMRIGSQSAADCSLCPPSTFSAAAVSTACTPCAAGSFSVGSGRSSASDCVAQAGCATAESLVAEGVIAVSASLCPTAGLQPIALSAVLPGATDHVSAFIARVGRLLRQLNSSDAAAATPAADAQAAAMRAALALYKPEKSLSSLRMAAAGSDATLSSFGATGAASHAPDDRDASSSTLSSASTAGLVTALLLVAFAPLLAYRFVPAKAVVWLDQFSLARKIGVGAFVSNTPSQLGAMVTWCFLVVALLVAVLLGLQDNTQRTTELLPPSVASMADTATASWQITLRAYTGEDAATMAAWCHSNNNMLLSLQRGFTGSFTLRAKPQGQSCAVLADCSSCGLGALAAAAFSFPYSAQLIEWELWVNGAQPNSWGRRYGVLTQMPGGRLRDAESELRFSVMESYYSDKRSASFAPGVAAANRRRSGFELNFLSLSSVRPQSADDFSARSTMIVTFALQKSDVVLESVLSDKQSLLQLGALIASAVVSLFSIFAIGYRLVEAHIFRRCGINVGDVRPVALTATGKMSEIELQPVEPPADLHVAGGRLRFRTLSRALGRDRDPGSSPGAVDSADPTHASSAAGNASTPFDSLSSISVAADPPSLADFRNLQRVQPESSPADPEVRSDEAVDVDGSILPDDVAVSEDWHAQL